MDWIGDENPTIQSKVPDIKIGDTVVLSEVLYLRGEPEDTWHTSGKVLSVLQVADRAKVVRSIEYSSPKTSEIVSQVG